MHSSYLTIEFEGGNSTIQVAEVWAAAGGGVAFDSDILDQKAEQNAQQNPAKDSDQEAEHRTADGTVEAGPKDP